MEQRESGKTQHPPDEPTESRPDDSGDPPDGAVGHRPDPPKGKNTDFADADAFAPDYDQSVLSHGWPSPEVLFDMVEGLVKPGDRLLDLGIGTGLSAAPFKAAGLSVIGMDGSQGMLSECERKGLADELVLHDLRKPPLPFPDHSFHILVACGVFHLVEDLDGIIADASRLLLPGGTFAFTFEELEETDPNSHATSTEGIQELLNDVTGIRSYRHSRTYVDGALARYGFALTGAQEYAAFAETEWAPERWFRAYVARSSR